MCVVQYDTPRVLLKGYDWNVCCVAGKNTPMSSLSGYEELIGSADTTARDSAAMLEGESLLPGVHRSGITPTLNSAETVWRSL